MNFRVHPDGRVHFSDGGLSYSDSVANFETDGSNPLPYRADGAGISITSDKSSLFYNGTQTAVSEEWVNFANEAVANIQSYCTAQTERREKEEVAKALEIESSITLEQKHRQAYDAAGLTIERLTLALLGAAEGDRTDLDAFIEERTVLRTSWQ